jgi:hypothetical protein
MLFKEDSEGESLEELLEDGTISLVEIRNISVQLRGLLLWSLQSTVSEIIERIKANACR